MERDNKKIAVLIDADNAQASVLESILNEVSLMGDATVKRIYGDFTNQQSSCWKSILQKNAIKPVQQFAYTTGKNATDGTLIIDAMDLLYTQRFDAFCLVSSDSDFTGLALRIRESGLDVVGFGELKTPMAFRNACNKFINTEIYKDKQESFTSDKRPRTAVESTELIPKEEIFETLLDIANNLSDADEEWIHLGVLGGIMTKRKPDFDARNYGYRNLSTMMKSRPDLFEVKKGAEIGISTAAHLPYMKTKVKE
ncbi:NYN domain-containing protein [Morganella morganii]|uniref:NYN domain-containing protein n=1 Tax=Morganella morganii TaxID=582 RepID=UPI0003DD1271|nr:NYN domain-containing protein [Morganella morganii]ELN8408288.1 NYN domain-containing protein [Morganella morganii]MBS9570727.1 NYN domain-containing protein [Morganella morganii subsp. morganii]MBT0357060.1 NYN domain-containing protein [Morganella morganii subsp. morganii]MBT0498157.1 NYN domain-containing protein [Morganella morganii subsp. morganii]MBW4178841.1 NYN domain-containing protein [Morganella morganii]